MAQIECNVQVMQDIHKRTVAHRSAAIEMGDDFLVYLLELVLRHLEDRLGRSGDFQGPSAGSSNRDPATMELAEKIIELAKGRALKRAPKAG